MLNAKMIGEKIAGARKRASLSQAQLAQQLFISPQAVGKWERGESMPDITTFNNLAELLHVDLNYFSTSFESSANESQFGDSSKPPTGDFQSQAQKPNWDMSKGNWVDADFSRLKNLHAKFSSSNMQRCKFIGSDLSELILQKNQVLDCDFTGSDIANSQIHYSHFTNDVFKICSLVESQISGSYFTGCDFEGANFSGAMLKSGGIERSNISGAVWNRSVFNSMYLAEITFDGQMQDCSFESCSFKRVTFHGVRLTNTFFKNNNLKGIRFDACESDRITYEFLKSGKADLTGGILLDS